MRKVFVFILLGFTLSAFAQDYKRPTADKDYSGGSGAPCSNLASNSTYGGVPLYYGSAALTSVYSGKSGAGPLTASSVSEYLEGYYPDRSVMVARDLYNWQNASGSYASLTLNANLSCWVDDGGDQAGGECAAFYSTNGGTSWTPLYSYTSYYGGSDNETTWTASITGATLANVQVAVCAVAFSDPGENGNDTTINVYDVWTTGVPANPPTISNLSPSSGLKGSPVTITGANFGSSQGTNTLTFNGVQAAITSWSSTSIVATVPTGATTGNVVVTVGGIASNGVAFTVATPTISGITPASGAVGTPVIIAGSYLGSSQGTSSLAFNGAEATITSWSSTSITAVVPASASSGNVVVTVAGEASNAMAFTVAAVPVISGLSPTTGAVGTPVTISGSGFGSSPSGSTVTFNGTPAAISSWSNTTVVAVVPAGATYGNVVLTVGSTTSNGVGFSPSGTGTIYSYSIPSYDGVGNILAYTDSVNGTWSMTGGSGGGYNTLNQLTGAQSSGGPYNSLQALWSYDPFGNRTAESFNWYPSFVTAQIPLNTSTTYNTSPPNNQIQSIQSVIGTVYPQYDAAGDVTQDSQNQYLYDGEGRICAVHNMLMGWTTGYVYNAEGVRVAKGALSWTGSGQPNWNTACSGQTGQNGWSMTITTSYILGPSNEQLTEMTWSGGSVQWAHTNVFAGGQLTATYTPVPNPGSSTQSVLNYHFTDWLGTRRVLTDQNGVVQQACTSLPYGNGESCSPTPTEHLFAGKERDTESGGLNGNDYFGARYFASTMGRFLSPDPSGIASVDPSNPQSWNFYSYARNNPFVFVDPTGLDPCQGSGPSENDESGMTSHDDDGGGGWSCATNDDSDSDQMFAAERQKLPTPTPNLTEKQLEKLLRELGYQWGYRQANPPPDGGCVLTDPNCAMQYAAWARGVARALNYLGAHPVFISANWIGSGQVTYQHSTKTICVDVGAGASSPPTRMFSAGIYNNGDMKNWTNVLSGFGYSFSSSAGVGYQATTNSSGTISGPVVGLPGVSGSYAWGACAAF